MSQLDAAADIAFVDSYPRAADTAPARGLKDWLRDLGVTQAEPVPAPGDGAKISVDQGPFVGWSGADSISEAVKRHLWQRDDNHEKLIQAKTGEDRRADEAHLLIWVSCGEPHRNGAHAVARRSMIELGDIPKTGFEGHRRRVGGDQRDKQPQLEPEQAAEPAAPPGTPRQTGNPA